MLTFDEVTLTFNDDTTALRDISLEIEEGERLLITGPSGSGKTSLMRLLTREYEPTTGEIFFMDTPVHELPRHKIPEHRRKIGVVFQDYKLLPELNVWENVALALSIVNTPQDETEHRITDLLHLVGLENKAGAFPSQLSGGEAQRVSIARALSTAPDLLFADEPTGNLDAETSANIVKLLRQINKLGTTLMVTSHDPVVIETLGNDRRLMLRQGEVENYTQSGKSKKTKSSKKVEEVEEKDDKEEIKEKETKEKSSKKEEKSKKEKTKPKTRLQLGLASLFSFGNKKSKDTAQEEKTEETKTTKEDNKDKDE